MTEILHNAPIVLDNGSGTIRAGFAGDDLPKCFFPSWVGRPKHLRVLAGALEGDVFIGQKAATELRGLLKIKYPLEHGIVTDWDDMERIWEYVYGEGLKTLSEEVCLIATKDGGSPATVLTSYAAPRSSDRATFEPSKQSRYSCADSFRNVQCPGSAHIYPSCSFIICQWPYHWYCSGCWRRSVACGPSL